MKKPTKTQHQIRIDGAAYARLEEIADTTGQSVACWASELLMAATDALSGTNRFDSMATWITRRQAAWTNAKAQQAQFEASQEALRAVRRPT